MAIFELLVASIMFIWTFVWLLWFHVLLLAHGVRSSPEAVRRNREKTKMRMRALRGYVGKPKTYDKSKYDLMYKRKMADTQRLDAQGVPEKVRLRVADASKLEFLIVVPTYNRHGPLKEFQKVADMEDPSLAEVPFILSRTLRFLHAQGICHDDVHLWVSDDRQRTLYSRALKQTFSQNVITKCGDWSDVRLCVGVPTIGAQRSFIARAYPENLHLIHIDDDIECMKMAVRRKNKNVVVEATKGDFEKIIKLGAKLMQTQSCFLWGLNPSSNDYFLKRSVSRKNGLVLGSCFGILNRWDTGLLASISERGHHEDVERTLRHIERDGRVPVDDVCSSPSRSL